MEYFSLILILIGYIVYAFLEAKSRDEYDKHQELKRQRELKKEEDYRIKRRLDLLHLPILKKELQEKLEKFDKLKDELNSIDREDRIEQASLYRQINAVQRDITDVNREIKLLEGFRVEDGRGLNYPPQ